MTIRVLEVLGSPRGAASAAMLEVARGLPRDRFQFSVASPAGDGALQQALAEIGVPWFEVPLGGKSDHLSFRRLRHEMKVRDIQVVHSHGRNANLHGGLAAHSRKLPWVPHLHSPLLGADGKAASQLADHLHHGTLRRFSARILGASQAVQRSALQVLGLPPSRVVHAPQGIELGPFVGVPESGRASVRRQLDLAPQDFAVLSLGSVEPGQGQDLTLEALAGIPTLQRPSWIVVGEGSERARLEKAAKQHRVEARFLGWRHDVPDLLAAADVLSRPARWEGFPRAMVEAMAAGCPVVASSVPGLCEFVDDEQSGLLVPAEDVKALRAALVRVGAEPELRRRLVETARSRVRRRHQLGPGLDIVARVLADTLRAKVGSAP